LEFPSLPPSGASSSTSEQELQIARTTLEIAALMFAQSDDMVSFERYLQRLLPYYVRDSPLRASMAPSTLEFQVIGLQLLHLIVEKRLSDFHLLLELLPAAAHADQCVAFAKTLEQSMMAGNYGKVLKARGDVPEAYYAGMMEKLVGTVRAEIASCSETAYAALPLAELQRMLLFPGTSELLAFCNAQDGWTVSGADVTFSAAGGASDSASKLPEIPAQRLVQNVLAYATELERIV
jgi:26S proteasome regulatory subunit N12|tara:strand:- start:51 stop:758 length:708 start_codon:yes stop_codon:yes gene_type:complete